MLKEIKARPVVAPLPVLIVGTYDENGVADAMNVAWGGQCWDRQIALNISSNHKTTDNLRLKKAFTVHIATAERVELADYLGIVSGHSEPKLIHVNATVTKGKIVYAPIIEDFVLAMECNVVSMTDNEDGGVRVVGEVVRTVADDTILDSDGKVDLGMLHPICFDQEKRVYRTIGAPIAEAFLVGKNLKGM